MTQRAITPVILSGGAGTRLWPVSRTARPKQMHALVGSSTMLQATLARVSGSSLFAEPVVVASDRHSDETEAQIEATGTGCRALILEPCGRNTAAAIALAALEAGGETLLLVMPSDHVIHDRDAFLAAVEAATPAAIDGWMVTFGIRPDRAETGYGYIKRGASIGAQVFAAERFIEKPDRQRAEQMVAEGFYDWNGGIFLFRADRFLEALEVHAPDIRADVEHAFRTARREGHRLFPELEAFSAVRSQSIDHAVMEHADRIAVVPMDVGWSDVGSWDALHDVSAKDDAGNHSSGDVLALDSEGCLLRSDGPLVVTVGVQDLIVIATGDAVLIAPRGESQRVKDVVEALKRRDHPTIDR